MKTQKKFMMLGFALILGLGMGMARADIDTGLIGYWPMDGDYDDAAGNNHGVAVDDTDIDLPNGTLSFDNDVKYPNFSTSLRIPATLYGSGYTDPDLEYNDWHDPADDYVDLGSAPDHDTAMATGDFTIAAWFKTTSTHGMIFGNGGDDGGGVRAYLGIGETDGGNICLTLDDNSTKEQINSNADINDGIWHHVAAMRRGNQTFMYIDGVLQTDYDDLAGGYSLAAMTQANSYIGCGYSLNPDRNYPAGTTTQYYQHKQFRTADGLVDEIRLYNRALTDADVLELYLDDSGSAGNKRPKITVPDELVHIGAPVDLQLTCTVSDDGLPLPTNPGSPNPSDPNKLRWILTAESWPTTSGGVAFSGNPSSGEAFTYNTPDTPITCDPTVTLDVPGLYVFKFSADDGEKDVNVLFQVKVFPTGYEGLILHYSFDGMSTGNTHIEDIAVDPFTFDAVTGLPVRYDHDGILMSGNPSVDPNIVQGPENNGTPPDVALLTAGKDFLQAVAFDNDYEQWAMCENDGVNELLDPDFPIRGNSPRTFMCWAYTEAFNNGGLWDMGTYSNGQDFCLRTMATTDVWRVQLWGFPTYDFDVTYDSLGKWVHFALVYDGSHIDVYADGKLLGGKDIALNTGTNVALRLAVYNNLNNFFDGVIDDFRVYNRALSAQEVIDAASIGNLAPDASAGPDLLLVEDVDGSFVTIPGVDNVVDPTKAWWTDVPGSVTIQWTQLSGPGTAVITNDTTISPTINLASQPYGLYNFELTVSDGNDPVNMPDAVDTMLIFFQAKSSYGLVGHWKLDESVGATAFDSSGNDLDGTLMGDPNLPVWQPAGGKVDGALQFVNAGDDGGQYVDLSDVPGVDDFTATLWLKAADLRDAALFDKLGSDGTGWGINISANGQMSLRVGGSTVPSSSTYAADEWVHVAATFDGTADEGKIYINGLEENSSSGITASANNMLPPLTLVEPVRAQLITSVDRTNGTSGDRDHIGAFTGETDPIQDQPGTLPDSWLLRDGHYSFSDRDYLWESTPTQMIDSEYVTTFNNDKGDDGDVNYAVTVSGPATFWVTLDDRFTTNQQAEVDQVVSDFATAGTFTDSGINLIIGEGGGRPMSVYISSVEVPAGTYNFGPQGSTYNFYTIGAFGTGAPAGYRGLVDQARLFDTVLSELDIALLAVNDGVEMEGCNLDIEGTQMVSDLNGDCYVDIQDLKLLLGNWLVCTDLNNPNCN